MKRTTSHFIMKNVIKHIMSKYFPGNWRMWKGSFCMQGHLILQQIQ